MSTTNSFAMILPPAGLITLLALSSPALAADAIAPEDNMGEIVVTAQKRSETLNNVGMTITAATGDQLKERGITSVVDLPRLVPGFTVQESAFNSTSYTLRGVGFFNSDLATPPAVSIYIDEAPLPYPTMTRLAAFDLERVEVLKGPQGTLYGQNATGGAVNYIAAKPTNELRMGIDAGYGRFDRFDFGGFVSGPLSDTLSARIALQGSRGGAWQKSTTRPGDKLGKVRQLQGRGTLLWEPGSNFTSRLSLTITHDGSETLAGQLLMPLPQVPELVNPALLTAPIRLSPRAADWTPGFDYKNDNTLYHLTWRNEWTLASDVTITALTSYARYETSYAQDFDGTPLLLYNAEANGSHIDTLFQELRAAGETERLRWIVGANYEYDKIFDAQRQRYRDYSASHIFDPASTVPFSGEARAGTKVHAYGIYANLDYQLTDTLSVQGGARYTRDKRKFAGCTFDVDFTVAQVVNAFQGFVNGGIPITPIGGGECITLDPADSFRPVSEVRRTLNEDNISWRAQLNWKATPDTLVYASLSRGYKAGTFPVVGASLINQFNPVTQESVLSYEAGIKAGLFGRLLQLNAAAFYYDYTDKQLRGKILDPVFGPLEALVTIPKSHVQGIEAQAVLRPIQGLVIDSSVTHVRSKIDRFVGVSSAGELGDFAGTPFPFSPKWQSVNDISYKFALNDAFDVFAGGTLTYNSRTNSGIGSPAVLTIDGFTLLDLRAGVETSDGKYRFTLWGKNVTNNYHWSSTFLGFDTVTRFVAPPATYGISLSGRF